MIDRRSLALMIMALVAGPVSAQTQGQTQAQPPSAAPIPATAPSAVHGPDIVVTGQRPSTKAEIRRLTRQVMVVGDAAEAVARFDQPVCPDAVGMPRAFDDRVARRIAEDARDAGIAVGKDGCHPNITIVFIDNGQALVREIRRAHPDLFGDMESHAIDRLAADPGPIHTWAITETTSRDGDTLRAGTSSGVRAPELQVRTASIVQLTTKRNIVTTILIIDIPAAIGKGLNQIADYAAMRTLAETRASVGAGGGQDTILRLFSPGDRPPPAGLTPFDRNYLRALYVGQGTLKPFDAASSIAARVNKALTGAVAAQR